MDHSSNKALQHFRSDVRIRFQLYNSLLVAVSPIETAFYFIVLSNWEGYLKTKTVTIDKFFKNIQACILKKSDILFRCATPKGKLVLFDALEDATFRDA
jgi:phosphoenolpyruvate carboxylase